MNHKIDFPLISLSLVYLKVNSLPKIILKRNMEDHWRVTIYVKEKLISLELSFNIQTNS